MPRKQRFKPSRKSKPTSISDGATAASARNGVNDVNGRVEAVRHDDIERDSQTELQTAHEIEQKPPPYSGAQVIPAETD